MECTMCWGCIRALHELFLSKGRQSNRGNVPKPDEWRTGEDGKECVQDQNFRERYHYDRFRSEKSERHLVFFDRAQRMVLVSFKKVESISSFSNLACTGAKETLRELDLHLGGALRRLFYLKQLVSTWCYRSNPFVLSCFWLNKSNGLFDFADSLLHSCRRNTV